MTSTGTLKIHTENILPIIKKWLYSDKDIFLRELVANACDAIHKTSILKDEGQSIGSEDPFSVQVKIDLDARTIQIIDNGIGMTRDEVEKYICQLAFSSAEEFLDKYKSNKEEDQIIGHFGLGFYSAYMVSKKVEIDSLSYREGSEPVKWECDGSSSYSLDKGERTTRGTTITLYVDEENGEYLEEGRLLEILHHYCSFLPQPIYLGEKRINEKDPLWMKAPIDCTDEDYLDFYRHLYPAAEDPLFWIHLNVDYPFHLKGILYFPKVNQNIDLKKSTVKLFCNRVFVSDNCKDLIPDYLMVLRGAIDSPDIPLNVSRSYLQMDRTVRQLATHVSKKVSDALTNLFNTDKERFLKCWRDIALILKLGAVEDEKFYERIKNLLVWKDSRNEWVTIDDYLERNKEKTEGKILYTIHEKQSPHLLNAYKQQDVDVLVADNPVDPYLIQFLERKIEAKFKRIDAGVDETLIDKQREKSVLDEEGKTEAGRIADFFRRQIEMENLEIEAKSLSAESLPAIVTMDEEMRRMRDFMQSNQTDSHLFDGQAFGKRTLILNTNSKLISSVFQLEKSDPVLAKELVHEVYELALLSQREMDPEKLNQFIERSQRILEALSVKAVSTGGKCCS